MKLLCTILAELVYRIRWWRWAFSRPYRLGDPALGKGAQRYINRRLLMGRWLAKEPQRRDR